MPLLTYCVATSTLETNGAYSMPPAAWRATVAVIVGVTPATTLLRCALRNSSQTTVDVAGNARYALT